MSDFCLLFKVFLLCFSQHATKLQKVFGLCKFYADKMWKIFIFIVQGDFEGIVTCNCHEMSVVRNNLSKKTKTGENRGENDFGADKKNRNKDRMIIKNEEWGMKD